MAKDNKFNVDQILEKLLSVRGAQPGKMVELTEAQITGWEHPQCSQKKILTGKYSLTGLCVRSRAIFLSQPALLELEAPIKICGLYSLF